MATGISPLNTAHRGTIHSAQLDHFGKRLATASADNCVRVWNVETRNFEAELRGHEAPVWTVAWAHPSFGTMLASGAADRRALVWREVGGEWAIAQSHEARGQINAVCFGPWEHGLQLAVAASDGQVAVLSHNDCAREPEERWRTEAFRAHEGGVFAVSWAPATSPASLECCEVAGRGVVVGPQRLVTGGADNSVRIWRHDESTRAWTHEYHFSSSEHRDWIRDVAWRPSVAIPAQTIASCAEDGSVVVWTQAMRGQPWQMQDKWHVDAAAWQVSWSATGSMLAISTSDNRVQVYKELSSGKWEGVATYDERGEAEPAWMGRVLPALKEDAEG